MEENGINIKDDIVEKIVKVLNILKEKNPKGVDVGQGTQKDKYNDYVDQPSINNNSLRVFYFTMRSNQGWSARGVQLAKINMMKFDGKDPITWIFKMGQFFEIHQVPNLQKVTIIQSLNSLCGTNGCVNERRTSSSLGLFLLENYSIP